MVLTPVAFGDSPLRVLITNLKQAKQNSHFFSIKKAPHSSHPQFPTHYKVFFYLFFTTLSLSVGKYKAHQATAGLFAAPGLQDVNCCGNHGQSSQQRGEFPSIKAKSIRKTLGVLNAENFKFSVPTDSDSQENTTFNLKPYRKLPKLIDNTEIMSV